ncbi:hypothetical protein PRUB_a0003 [Pseudoalteromonas rubra]|uniref:Uncharacterized protein n=1 Tax=Pseudoalteromonas rubra TaxID=43658 RepID=A0A8T0C4J1_9GAMM|nr:hypothetical protein PRUB_a0003 [Pseudoalteromonas rubra]
MDVPRCSQCTSNELAFQHCRTLLLTEQHKVAGFRSGLLD